MLKRERQGDKKDILFLKNELDLNRIEDVFKTGKVLKSAGETHWRGYYLVTDR